MLSGEKLVCLPENYNWKIVLLYHITFGGCLDL
jgi:hypothetical protein